MPYRGADDPPPRRRTVLSCPSCHARVFTSAEGECPSCRKNVNEVIDDGRRSITVRDGRDLPGVCAQCGETCKRRVRLRPTLTGDGNAMWFRVLVFLWNPIIGLLVPGREKHRVSVGMALCSGCEPLPLEHVDFQHGAITLIVHGNLYAAVSDPRP